MPALSANPFETKKPHQAFAEQVSKLVRSEAYERVVELLNDHKPQSALGRDFDHYATEWQLLFNHLGDTWATLDGRHRKVFGALIYKGLSVEHMYFLRRREEYEADIQSFREGSPFAREQRLLYGKLAHHPLATALRDELVYLDRAAALDDLKLVWSAEDKSGFLYLVDALTELQDRAQRRTDPKLSEERLIDGIASYPGLELVILSVRRGNAPDAGMRLAPLPPLRIIISNMPVPVDYSPSEPDNPQSAWSRETTDFWLLSAKGTYPSVKSYVRDALTQNGESVGHGPYYFASNDDRCLSTAANVLTALHHFLAKPSNFAANAQARAKEQLRGIETAAVGPIYAHRYLRTQGMATWTVALGVANGHRRKDPPVNPYAVAKELVVHGMVAALDSVMTTDFYEGDEGRLARDGLIDGINQLLQSMQQLSEDGAQAAALAQYETERGFHPDVMLFPEDERKKLAFQDLSNIAVANLTGVTVLSSIMDNEHDFPSRVPLLKVAQTMLRGRDTTNFMRLYENTIINRLPDMKEALEKIVRAEGYFITPMFMAKSVKDIEVRALLDRQGALQLRTRHMTRYKTVEQIVHDETLTEALLAQELLGSIRFPAELEPRKKEQLASLKDLIATRSLVAQLREEVTLVSEEDKPDYIQTLRWQTFKYVDQLKANGVQDPERAVSNAVAEVTGAKAKPLFGRVIRALSGVSSILSNKPGK